MADLRKKKSNSGVAGGETMQGSQGLRAKAADARMQAVHNPVFESRARQSTRLENKIAASQRAMRENSPKKGFERARADARGYLQAVKRGGFQDSNGARKPSEEDFQDYKQYWLGEKPYSIKKKNGRK